MLLGDIRKVAKDIRTNHELALELWATGTIDARYLAILLMLPRRLTREELDSLVRSTSFAGLPTGSTRTSSASIREGVAATSLDDRL